MANNVHHTYSYGAAASGDMHQPPTALRMNPGRVSLHPLQRQGKVSATGGYGSQSAQGFNGLGGDFPASIVNMNLPPTVPITNGDMERFAI
jgi:hypothetical protein